MMETLTRYRWTRHGHEDVAKYLPDAKDKGEWQGGRRWEMDCPWEPNHKRSAWVAQFPNGAITAGCQHNSCKGKNWHELRDIHDPRPQPGRAENRSDGPIGKEGSSVRSFTFLTGQDIARATPEEIAWIVEGLIAAGSIVELDGKVKTSGPSNMRSEARRTSTGWRIGRTNRRGFVRPIRITTTTSDGRTHLLIERPIFRPMSLRTGGAGICPCLRTRVTSGTTVTNQEWRMSRTRPMSRMLAATAAARRRPGKAPAPRVSRICHGRRMAHP